MHIASVSDLKRAVESRGDSPYYFTRETMRFFGDTMKNYGVRKVTVKTRDGDIKQAYELFRRKPVKHGLKDSAFFDVKTFGRIFNPEIMES